MKAPRLMRRAVSTPKRIGLVSAAEAAASVESNPAHRRALHVPRTIWHRESGVPFPVGRPIILEGGVVMPVEKLAVDSRFLMQHGQIATVTAVEPPAWWQPPADRPDNGKTLDRRVIGRSERFGNAVIDLFFLGRTVTTTPDHLFYSFSRKTICPRSNCISANFWPPTTAAPRR